MARFLTPDAVSLNAVPPTARPRLYFLAFERPDTGALEIVEVQPLYRRFGRHGAWQIDGVYVSLPTRGRRRSRPTGEWSLMQFRAKQARGAMCLVW